jgi:CDP-glycerol glycerophosphotransferase
MIKVFLAKSITLVKYLFIWSVVVPLGYIIPKKSNLITFIGRDDGLFVDNIKYLFIYIKSLEKEKVILYFLTQNQATFSLLKEHDLPVILYPTAFSVFVLLRTRILLVDTNRWTEKMKYYLLFKSYKIQLWHGVPLKRIELDRKDLGLSSLKTRIKYTIIGRFPTYDLLISTSEYFTKNIFSKAFKYKEIVESGFPRNDVFSVELNNDYLLGTDIETLKKVKEFKGKGYKTILYVPTHRNKKRSENIKYNALHIDGLVKFSKKYKILFVFKFHFVPHHNLIYKTNEEENLIVYNNSKDVYPLLPLVDLMITDYSSIYMDFLLLDKPVIFFPYDYQEYVESEDLPFDYQSLTPGSICYSQEELENEIVKTLIESKDKYKEKRKAILEIAFKYVKVNSSEGIWNLIKERHLQI